MRMQLFVVRSIRQSNAREPKNLIITCPLPGGNNQHNIQQSAIRGSIHNVIQHESGQVIPLLTSRQHFCRNISRVLVRRNMSCQ